MLFSSLLYQCYNYFMQYKHVDSIYCTWRQEGESSSKALLAVLYCNWIEVGNRSPSSLSQASNCGRQLPTVGGQAVPYHLVHRRSRFSRNPMRLQ